MMPISTILSLIRDAIIIGGILFIGIFVYRSGQNADIKADLVALQKQLKNNSDDEHRWERERSDAEIQRNDELAGLTAAIGRNRSPVFLQKCPRSGTVPGNPPAAAGSAPSPGPVAEGPGIDLRPAINALEIEYEGYLATCRSVLNSWPH
jgi:hypothetical protein